MPRAGFETVAPVRLEMPHAVARRRRLAQLRPMTARDRSPGGGGPPDRAGGARPAAGPQPDRPPEPPWDDRYADGDWIDLARPAAIVRDAASWLEGAGGVAWDVACGAGRNALHLAAAGWRVLAVDRSAEGLRRLRRRAHERELPVQPVRADLARFALEPASVDLVVNTHFLLRPLFPRLRAALRPGGLLLFETFSVHEIEELGGDVRRAFALERGELARAFAGWEVLLYEEGVFEREEGERGLARLIARKPGRTRG